MLESQASLYLSPAHHDEWTRATGPSDGILELVIAMNPKSSQETDLEAVSDDVLTELIRRVQAIGIGYRELAQKMGQLYMYADQQALTSLTRSLDKPMRMASDTERAAADILDRLQVHSNRRKQRKN